MKKYNWIIILPFIILANCNSNGETMPENQTIKNLAIYENSTIVCFGDSLTFGHGAENIEHSYPMILQNFVTIPVINSGVNDDTTAGGLSRIQKDVLDYNPVIVIIEFGGNDLYNSKPKLKIKEIEKNLRQMIELIDNGNTKIYIARFFNNQMRFLDVFFSFDRMLNRLKKEYDIEIIYNVWENIWGKKELKYDFTHPNSKGYEIMANNIFNTIKPILEYNNIIK